MRTTRTLTAVLLVALAAPLMPIALERAAMAQAPADDAATKAARARFQAGVDFYDKGEYEKARVEFSQAYALKSHPAVLLNYAQSSLKSGHALEASRLFQKYLKDPTAPADKRGEAEAGLSEARAKISRLDLQVANGTEINVDGEKIGFAPLDAPLDVEPGAHVVKTKGPEGVSEQRVTVVAGQTLQVKGNAAATPTPTPTATNTTPTPTPTQTPDGTQAVVPNPPPDPGSADTGASGHKNWLAPPKPLWPVFVLGGVGVAGVGMSITMWAVSQTANDKAKSTAAQIAAAAKAYNVPTNGACSPQSIAKFPSGVQPQVKSNCDSLNTSQNNSNTDATIGYVALGFGIAGVVGAVVYYFAGPGKPDKQAASSSKPVFVPWIGTDQGGATILGTF